MKFRPAEHRGYAYLGARTAKMVRTSFDPVCLGDWFHGRIEEWSATLAKGPASTHVFRKTSLQYARRGEDVSRRVAADAAVSEGVMMTHYVEEADPELREASNRMHERIVASLPIEVARRYGHAEAVASDLERRLRAAIASEDWSMVTALSGRLASQRRSPTG